MAGKLLFKKLPLVEVAVRLTFVEEIPTEVSFAADLRDNIQLSEAVSLESSYLMDVAPGLPPEMVIEFGSRLRAFALRLPERGLVAHVFSRHVAVIWSGAADFPVDTSRTSDETEDYPGFEAGMKPALDLIVSAISDILGGLQIYVAQLSYTSDFRVEGGATVFDYLRLVDPDTLAFHPGVIAFDFTSQREDGISMRASCRHNEGRAWVQTAAGLQIGNQALEEGLNALNTVHNVLTLGFSEILTEQARTEWEIVER